MLPSSLRKHGDLGPITDHSIVMCDRRVRSETNLMYIYSDKMMNLIVFAQHTHNRIN